MMKAKVTKQKHYEKDVWTNEIMDGLRPTECLCLNCELECVFAESLFDICKDGNLALAVTRCPDYSPKKYDLRR